MSAALDSLDINLLDHLIVARSGYFSFFQIKDCYNGSSSVCPTLVFVLESTIIGGIYSLNGTSSCALKSYLKHHSDADKERSIHHGTRWLIHSINRGVNRGSGTYYHHSGWTSAYPETTGYIIDTLLRYSTESNFPWVREARSAAQEAGQWLLSIQHEDGGWPGGYVHQQRPSVVFNTGQILRGLLPLYRTTGDRLCGGCETRH